MFDRISTKTFIELPVRVHRLLKCTWGLYWKDFYFESPIVTRVELGRSKVQLTLLLFFLNLKNKIIVMLLVFLLNIG